MKPKDRYGWGVATFILGGITLICIFTGLFPLAIFFGIATCVTAATNEENIREDSR